MSKYSAHGTILLHGSTAVGQVMNISGPGLSLDTEDVTSHDSTAAWEEHVGTILRSGEVSLDLVYDPNNTTHSMSSAGDDGLLYAMTLRTATAWTLTFPSTAAVSWTFNAFVTGFEPSMPHDGALTASVKMKLTGQPTLA